MVGALGGLVVDGDDLIHAPGAAVVLQNVDALGYCQTAKISVGPGLHGNVELAADGRARVGGWGGDALICGTVAHLGVDHLIAPGAAGIFEHTDTANGHSDAAAKVGVCAGAADVGHALGGCAGHGGWGGLAAEDVTRISQFVAGVEDSLNSRSFVS